MAQNAARMNRVDARPARTMDRREKRLEERAATINRRAIRKAFREMLPPDHLRTILDARVEAVRTVLGA